MKQIIIGPSNVESKSFLSMSFTFQKKTSENYREGVYQRESIKKIQ